MVNPQLLAYIRDQEAAGSTQVDIQDALLKQGWANADVGEAFAQTSTQTRQSGARMGKWVLILVIVILIGAGGAFAAFQYNLSPSSPMEISSPISEPTPTLVVSSAPIESASTSTGSAAEATTTRMKQTTVCGTYQCLLAAAAQCKPISVTISYSGTPSPLNPELFSSGKTIYEIKKSSGTSPNDCTLVISPLTMSLTFSDKGRKSALASGMSDAQITAQLQAMNASIKSLAEAQTTCPSVATTIVAYLSDVAKANGNLNVEVKSDLTQTTTIYTTSSGQKLTCHN